MPATTHFKMFLSDARPEQLAVALNRTDYTLDDRAFVEFDLAGSTPNPALTFGSDAPGPPDSPLDTPVQIASTLDQSLLVDSDESAGEEADAQLLVP